MRRGRGREGDEGTGRGQGRLGFDQPVYLASLTVHSWAAARRRCGPEYRERHRCHRQARVLTNSESSPDTEPSAFHIYFCDIEFFLRQPASEHRSGSRLPIRFPGPYTQRRDSRYLVANPELDHHWRSHTRQSSTVQLTGTREGRHRTALELSSLCRSWSALVGVVHFVRPSTLLDSIQK